MTKSDIRILTMADMELYEGAHFLDIGSGTGSIAISAASLGCITTACECEGEALRLIRENARRFKVAVRVIEGKAPECLDEAIYDRIFIGGNRGRLEGILAYAHEHLEEGGIICGNFVTLANAETMRGFLRDRNYEVAVKYVAVSREDKIGILRAENGIMMIRGRRK